MMVTPGTPGTCGTCGFVVLAERFSSLAITYMNLNLAIMLSKLLLLLRSEILISEKDNRSLRNQKSKLILLLVSKIFQLKTNNLGPNVRSQVNDFLGSTKQSAFRFVCSSSSLYMLTLNVPNIGSVVEVERFGRALGIAVAEINSGLLETGPSCCWEGKGVFLLDDKVFDAFVNGNFNC